MAIQYPTNRNEIYERSVTDLQNALQTPIKLLHNSLIKAFIVSNSLRQFEIYDTIRILQNMLFPDTAEGEFAESWAAFKKIERYVATPARGLITIVGVVGTAIPVNSVLNTADGIGYKTTISTSIINTVFSVTSITRIGTTVTVTTVTSHNFASGQDVTISGATQTEYNGTYAIIVIGNDQFTYEITNTPATPATGTIFANAAMASIEVVSVNFGANTNTTNGTQLSFEAPVAGISNVATVQYNGLIGGADRETDDAFRERYLYFYANPIAHFNESDIRNTILAYRNTLKIWVFRTTPSAGFGTIYFTVNRDNIIPTAADIDIVKALVYKIAPIELPEANILILAPTAVVTNFSFSSINPNTDTMKTAVEASLKATFAENADVGQDFKKLTYDSAIWNTIDPANGDRVQSFVLTTPTGDISVSTGQLAILGTINWT